MSVYLGNFGEVELKREFDGSELRGTVNPSDVNVTAKRFSFDFDHGQLISGDQVEITTTGISEGASLGFIDSYTQSSIKKYVHVDELDGVRLYDTFALAVAGGSTNAVALATTTNLLEVRVVVMNATFRVLGRVQSYELNTQRETVDVTTLSDDFRNRIGTLMSGSGRMACEWEYTGDTARELPHYLLELILRTKVGSTFSGRFYVKTASYNPANHTDATDDAIWYQVRGVLTACAVQFMPNRMVQITADFITTGPVELRMELEPIDLLLKDQDGDELLLDQGGDSLGLESF